MVILLDLARPLDEPSALLTAVTQPVSVVIRLAPTLDSQAEDELAWAEYLSAIVFLAESVAPFCSALSVVGGRTTGIHLECDVREGREFVRTLRRLAPLFREWDDDAP